MFDIPSKFLSSTTNLVQTLPSSTIEWFRRRNIGDDNLYETRGDPAEGPFSILLNMILLYQHFLSEGEDFQTIDELVCESVNIASSLRNGSMDYLFVWIMERDWYIVRGHRSMPPKLSSTPQTCDEYFGALCQLYEFATDEWCASFCNSDITQDQLSRLADIALTHLEKIPPQVKDELENKLLAFHHRWIRINIARHTKSSYQMVEDDIREVLDLYHTSGELPPPPEEMIFQLATLLPPAIRNFGWDAERFRLLHSSLLTVAEKADLHKGEPKRFQQQREDFEKVAKGE
ncbi:hypothetical protein M501DRAFT_1061909 [Patellaria atrata CBS 101060]|uniref:Uncharacterized protein n=1 Tax=Patellaria atrata CBS 101060 TaxID=1346257 RepID=A0A9P4S0P7_9PEZI|nr:hypothetical protein M501DRAFT_1061909 [Patellaria atrata CBS 101060]